MQMHLGTKSTFISLCHSKHLLLNPSFTDNPAYRMPSAHYTKSMSPAVNSLRQQSVIVITISLLNCRNFCNALFRLLMPLICVSFSRYKFSDTAGSFSLTMAFFYRTIDVRLSSKNEWCHASSCMGIKKQPSLCQLSEPCSSKIYGTVNYRFVITVKFCP